MIDLSGILLMIPVGLGLPPHLVRVIMLCISNSLSYLLWNGEPSEEFKPSWGLHQGDPLSPYLFVLCLERLGHSIIEKDLEGEWKSICLSQGGQNYPIYVLRMT